MADADLILYLERRLSNAQWRAVAEELAEPAGIRAIKPVARESGRLLHVRYDPGQWSPATVGATARSMGFPNRVAAL